MVVGVHGPHSNRDRMYEDFALLLAKARRQDHVTILGDVNFDASPYIESVALHGDSPPTILEAFAEARKLTVTFPKPPSAPCDGPHSAVSSVSPILRV